MLHFAANCIAIGQNFRQCFSSQRVTECRLRKEPLKSNIKNSYWHNLIKITYSRITRIFNLTNGFRSIDSFIVTNGVNTNCDRILRQDFLRWNIERHCSQVYLKMKILNYKISFRQAILQNMD